MFLLHGGPGAAGYLAPVARELAATCRVVEPFQRRSGGDPLTVARHVQDLLDLIAAHKLPEPNDPEPSPERAVLVGHSWGAMLALAFAAAHPRAARSIVLIGCGTFDLASRERLRAVRAERMTEVLRQRERRLLRRFVEPDQRLKAMGSLHRNIDSVDPLPGRDELAECDARGHDETWADMLRLQHAGVYPAAFARIQVPVLMLHGAQDSHPGPMIRDSLAACLPHLEYVELERCGHYPWVERAARERFFELLKSWLSRDGR